MIKFQLTKKSKKLLWSYPEIDSQKALKYTNSQVAFLDPLKKIPQIMAKESILIPNIM